MQQVNRRTVLKVSMLAAASLLLSSCNDEVDDGTLEGQVEHGAGTRMRSDVIVIGAGIAGLAAARELKSRGYAPIILEARDRIGGRTWTDTRLGVPVDLGASWIHGVQGNPITELADEVGVERVETNFENIYRYTMAGVISEADDYALDERAEAVIEDAAAIGEDKDEDQSLRAGIEEAVADEGLSEKDRAHLEYAIATGIGHEFAGDPEELSLWWYDNAQEFRGGDVLLPGGYVQIVGHVASGLDVRLGQVVGRIAYGDGGVEVVTNQGTFAADYVVVTLPLGVLKQGKVSFEPALPSDKQEAINALGMGLLNKLYLRFAEVFWDEAADVIGYIGEERGLWAEWYNLVSVTGEPVLLGFNAGSVAREIEGWTDEQNVESAMDVLRTIYGEDIPEPETYVITRWASDPFAGGSYSFMAVGATPKHVAALAAPLADRVFFAGEATASDYPATVHGAYLSGLRAAEEVDAE